MVRFTLIYLDIMHVVKKGLWLHFAIKSKEEPMKSDANWFRWTKVNIHLGSAKVKSVSNHIRLRSSESTKMSVILSAKWGMGLPIQWRMCSAARSIHCWCQTFFTVWTAPILDIRNTSLIHKYPWSEVTKDYGLFLLLLYCWNKPKVG